jgi:O-antigen ligase
LIRNLSLAIIVLAMVVYFGYEQIVSNDSLLARIERSQTHGMGQRSFMYPALFKYWYQSENPLNLLFGYGYSTPVKIVGNYAHNDWLELLTSFGLTGVFIYVMIFVQFVRLSIKKLMPANLRFLVLTVVLSLLSRSIFSMGYISDITFISMLFIVLAIEANPRNQKDDENIVRN